MALWNAFPLEVQTLILRCFCRQIVIEYIVIPVRPMNTQITQCRHAPRPISDLRAALLVSRQFYYIIHHDVHLSRISFPLAMESLQNGKVQELLSDLNLEITTPSQVSAIVNQIGYLWNNQFINIDDMGNFLSCLPYEGITMLIPYFANFFRRNSFADSPASIRLRLDDDEESSLVFIGTTIISLAKWEVTNIQGLNGVLEGEPEGLVGDIARSDAYTWFSLQSVDDPLAWWAIKYDPDVVMYEGPLHVDEVTEVTW